MTVIKPSPTFLTSSLNFILPPSTINYLPFNCPCHRNFGYVQNFHLVIENHFWPPYREVKPSFLFLNRDQNGLFLWISTENRHLTLPPRWEGGLTNCHKSGSLIYLQSVHTVIDQKVYFHMEIILPVTCRTPVSMSLTVIFTNGVILVSSLPASGIGWLNPLTAMGIWRLGFILIGELSCVIWLLSVGCIWKKSDSRISINQPLIICLE